jgi:TonB family protein
MSSAAVLSTRPIKPSEELPFKKGMVISLLLHVMVLVVIPLLIQAVATSARFERPVTFQLVVAPTSVRPLMPATGKKLSTRSVQKKIKKEAVKPVPRESTRPEENLDELASVLDEIPVPARISAVGDFKYNWYLAQTQEKIERYWNPFFENKRDSVVVSFTIYGDGTISTPAIFRKSGNSALDNAALRAITLAAPFGKLPAGISGNQYEMLCTLRPTRN